MITQLISKKSFLLSLKSLATLMFVTISLISCSGGGSAPTPPPPAPQTAATPALTFTQVKGFTFSWTDVTDATEYRLMENPDGTSGFTQVGSSITTGLGTVTISVPLYKRMNAQYLLQSCNAGGCIDSTTVTVSGSLVASIGYVKASNTEADDEFGNAVSLSGDGNTLAVAANREDSNASGIDGDQADNNTRDAGAVYIFTRTGTSWSPQAYVKASNGDVRDNFGHSLSLSNDGNTLAVGVIREDSNATGINGNQSDNTASGSGAVYVFTRTGAIWSQQAYVKASNAEAGDQFGGSVNLSGDGNTLSVGAFGEDSNAVGIDGNQADNSIGFAGAVYVFMRTGSTWSQQTYVKASNTGVDAFGVSVSLSNDGNTLAVGANTEGSNATGINGDQADNSAIGAGAVYVFTRVSSAWSQQAYIKASNTEAGDFFGNSLSLSGDGNTLVVGAINESSNASGIDGNQADNSVNAAGAAYVFARAGSTWSQQAYVKAGNTGANDNFGLSVSLSNDGNIMAVGTVSESSNASGIGGDQTDNSASVSGAVTVFRRMNSIWNQQAYVKASNTAANDSLGNSVSLSGNGDTLAAGANFEESNATGVGGNQSDNSAGGAGAVYLY